MVDLYGQGDAAVRCDWGLAGARAVGAEVTVVVDVLSFSTSVTIAVERDMAVYPCPWADGRASDLARTHDAVLAASREAARSAAALGTTPPPSLSPASLIACEPVPRLVLPSPNGSSISAALAERGATVAIGCLRNAGAIARWLVAQLEAGRAVAVIAAGERWAADDSLRPALEDLVGAGAILDAVAAQSDAAFSPEAQVAAGVYASMPDRGVGVLYDCVSGRELISRGCVADVDAAAVLDASAVVPVLREGAFVAA